MIPKEKLRQIVNRLLQRSKADEVVWQGTQGSKYMVHFPDSWLAIDYHAPTTEPAFVSIEIGRPDGKSIANWDLLEGDEGWAEARQLYSEAERAVIGWDRVLSDVEAALGQEGKIGLPPSGYGTYLDEFDEIPF